MIEEIILAVLFWIAVPILVLFVVVKLIIGAFRKKKVPNENPATALSLSKEDAVSQLFFLLAVLFFCVGITIINKNFGSPLSWQTIALMTSLATFFVSYYFKALYCTLIGISAIFAWWIGSASEWIETENQTAVFNVQSISILGGSALLLLILYLAGKLHGANEKYKRYSYSYQVLSLVPLLAILFFLSSQFGLEAIEDFLGGKSSFLALWQLTVSLLVFLFVFIFFLIQAFLKKIIALPELIAISLIALFFVFLSFAPEQRLLDAHRPGNYSRALTSSGIFFAIILNFGAFFQLLALILFGYAKKETWFINLGSISLFIFITLKYFDWFFSFLDKSIFFIGAGILLFVVGWFMERGRRMMIAKIKTTTEATIQFS